MSTSFHPQTDGASERAIRSVGQLLRVMVQPDQKDWRDKIPMAEFAINLSISGSTGFAPFELNYGYMPTFTGGITPVETAQPGVKQFVQRAIDNMAMAHDAIIESRIVQTHHASKRRRKATPYEVGESIPLHKELSSSQGKSTETYAQIYWAIQDT